MHRAVPRPSSPHTETGRICLFPDQYPDELHASQAGRYHAAHANRDTRETFRQLYGTAPFRLTHVIPLHLEEFASRLPGLAADNLEKLLRHNTLFPLFETFGNAALSLPRDGTPLSRQITKMPKRIVGEGARIRLCLDCLRSDREEYGEPYIHRSHQLPGSDVCWNHGSCLLICCPFCHEPFESKKTADLILAPWIRCGCGHYLPDDTSLQSHRDASEVEIEFTRFVHGILNSPSQPLNASVLTSLYRQRLSELGLLRKSQIDRVGVVAALEAYFGKELLAKIDLAYRSVRSQHWLRMLSRTAAFDVPVTRHLLIAHFLFREATVFLRAAQATKWEQSDQDGLAEADGRPRRRSARRPGNADAPPEATPLPVEKRKVLAILQQHPDWTIDDLWHEHRGLLKKLIRKHTLKALEWLAHAIAAGQSHAPPKRVVKKPPHPEDSAWAARFQAAATKQYRSAERPIYTSRNCIMRLAGWMLPNRPDPERFPLARKALDDMAESQWHFYARRTLWAKLTLGAGCRAPAMITKKSGIEHHRGKDLLEQFATLSASRALQEGTIAEILDEFGINNHWAGLPGKPEYYVPGRNYSPQRDQVHAAPAPARTPRNASLHDEESSALGA